MKKTILNFLALIAIGSFVFISCDDNDSDSNPELTEAITEEETVALVESDDISDEVDNILEDILVEDFYTTSSKDEAGKDSETQRVIPECMIRTVVKEGNTKTVTVDFGDGCEIAFGHVLSGKVIMSYVYDLEVKTVTITNTFDGFTFNEVLIEGENVIVRAKENENGNPQSVKTINVKHTWPDDEFVTRTGTRTREWVEGFDTKTWGDNVFLITGNKATTFKNGTVCNSEIIEPLRREMACRFIVSGILEISKGDKNGTLNFGDGSCDNKAVFTNIAGETKEITLRKRNWNK